MQEQFCHRDGDGFFAYCCQCGERTDKCHPTGPITAEECETGLALTTCDCDPDMTPHWRHDYHELIEERDGKPLRHTCATSEGYNVQDQRNQGDGAKEAYAALAQLKADTKLSLYIRAGFWGSGHVETREGYILKEHKLPAVLREYLAFRGPND